ncbi:MAG TPA: hypothetical protein P5270_00570 [Victivallales bacterium]|mgnify:CR=1 FL=1|nr:hypothetical protein [Victivallales bacterium]HRR27833.1 hypothetical protein [Victivallales bacterium]
MKSIVSCNVKRSSKNPLITFDSSDILGNNINGPSVIRVPEWIRNPFGKYYMYFGHHTGTFIRLAYSDNIEGPWKIYTPGVLHIENTPFDGHIASPDIYIDNQNREIRMYFHSAAIKGTINQKGQFTSFATSKDGLNFSCSQQILGPYYFRVFHWKGYYYAIAKKGNSGWGELLRSKDGVSPFESRGNFIRMMRHCAVLLKNDFLLIFYSRVNDEPERILLSTVELKDNWHLWKESLPIEIMRPETEYEGINYPLKKSSYGPGINLCELRDPFVIEDNGRIFLFYTIAGEMGIAVAELKLFWK